MPKPLEQTIEVNCIGIDPGLNGGIAFISIDWGIVDTSKMPATDADLIEELLTWKVAAENSCKAVIEQQIPRPTFFNGKSSILKSTCLLYGQYKALCMALTALKIPFEIVSPRKWQKAFNLVKKKGETNTRWKNRLKAKAQQLFPKVKVTLATADALLIAEYCRRQA